MGLIESVRVRVEYAGRCHLTEIQASQLWWSKVVFAIMVPVSLLVPMPIMTLGQQFPYLFAQFGIPFVRHATVQRSCVRYTIVVAGFGTQSDSSGRPCAESKYIVFMQM